MNRNVAFHPPRKLLVLSAAVLAAACLPGCGGSEADFIARPGTVAAAIPMVPAPSIEDVSSNEGQDEFIDDRRAVSSSQCDTACSAPNGWGRIEE